MHFGPICPSWRSYALPYFTYGPYHACTVMTYRPTYNIYWPSVFTKFLREIRKSNICYITYSSTTWSLSWQGVCVINILSNLDVKSRKFPFEHAYVQSSTHSLLVPLFCARKRWSLGDVIFLVLAEYSNYHVRSHYGMLAVRDDNQQECYKCKCDV